MREIRSSGSGEGPGWETSRPTLQRPFHAALPAVPAPAFPAAGPAAPGALVCHPACRPSPPVRPAARRSAVAHGLDRPRCGGGADFQGNSTRMAKGILHAQRDERHLRDAHVANEPTHNGVGLGNPIERCLASTGRGNRRRVGRALQMAENLADHLDLGDGGDNAQCSLTAQGKVARLPPPTQWRKTRGHIQSKHTP